jgi:hypothetical protein
MCQEVARNEVLQVEGGVPGIKGLAGLAKEFIP